VPIVGKPPCCPWMSASAYGIESPLLSTPRVSIVARKLGRRAHQCRTSDPRERGRAPSYSRRRGQRGRSWSSTPTPTRPHPATRSTPRRGVEWIIRLSSWKCVSVIFSGPKMFCCANSRSDIPLAR